MKKCLFFTLCFLLLTSCSVKTNEEKAREIIEPEVKSSLIIPESYEFAQLQLDSCFSDSKQNPKKIEIALKMAKMINDYKRFTYDAESAESSMAIYAPSYGYQSAFSKQQYKKYKAEMEKAKRKASNIKDLILKTFVEYKDMFGAYESGKHEFIGWRADLSYRAETAGGLKTMGQVLFFLDKDLTKVTHRFDDEEMNSVSYSNFEDFFYELDEDMRTDQ